MSRVYLDWNATAPLRPEAREAMIAAMDLVGNPSSVHGEGRKAKAVVETARARVAEAFGTSGADIVFTSGATEAAALALSGRDLAGSAVEHDCVGMWVREVLEVSSDGAVRVADPGRSVLQAANSETGVIQNIPSGVMFCDAVQMVGKVPFGFAWSGAQMMAGSAHKIGGPKGVGCLVMREGLDVSPQIRGGGQEMGRRAGTENLIGIAGFGAAAAASQKDFETGAWAQVEEMRDAMEAMILDAAPDAVIVGKGAARLPNTSNIAVPGLKGETQVMQMDLAGFAVSAGSACSSGKVKTSRVLKAMGFDDVTAASAIRVSIGPTTRQDDVTRFAETWIDHYRRFKARAA